MDPVKIEVHDVQGIVLRDYLELEAASFLLLRFGEAAAARAWLSELADEVTPTQAALGDTCVNLAFTQAGLAHLDVPVATLFGFADEFLEGLAINEHRSHILGDRGDCEPARWRWGGTSTPAIHAALLLYARDAALHAAQRTHHRERLAAAGIVVETILDTTALPDHKEHFGFRDGISQPRIENANPDHERVGVLERQLPNNTVKAGEFLLGHVNGYGLKTPSPSIPEPLDPGGFLPAHSWGGRDLGRNGSYLVLRQLTQDVSRFWSHLHKQLEPTEHLEALGAKMVGRWTNGAPLVQAPEAPVEGSDETFADFLYQSEDPDGMRCPLGSHLRRCNPRDDLMGGRDESMRLSNLHRIIRRGRPFGPPLDPELRPEKMAEIRDGAERGLHFLGFNADLGRQFEFIQHNWMNYPKFNDLYSDEDPLAGPRQLQGHDSFTVQQRPVRRRVTQLPRFVRVVGGAYFFAPSLSALRCLGALAVD